jgi:hypothetical protein
VRIFGLVVFLFLSSSFACDTIDEADRRTEFALAAVEDNILTTDYTALVEITKANAEEIAGGNAAEGDEELVAVKYTAKVLETFVGNAQKNIVFTEYVEKNEGLEDLSSGVLIVSLCKDKDGNYYLPDIGYELPAQNVIVEKAREIKALIKDKKLSLRKNNDNYACDP